MSMEFKWKDIEHSDGFKISILYLDTFAVSVFESHAGDITGTMQGKLVHANMGRLPYNTIGECKKYIECLVRDGKLIDPDITAEKLMKASSSRKIKPRKNKEFENLMKEIQGELYPCKPDIFEETYEPVED